MMRREHRHRRQGRLFAAPVPEKRPSLRNAQMHCATARDRSIPVWLIGRSRRACGAGNAVSATATVPSLGRGSLVTQRPMPTARVPAIIARPVPRPIQSVSACGTGRAKASAWGPSTPPTQKPQHPAPHPESMHKNHDGPIRRGAGITTVSAGGTSPLQVPSIHRCLPNRQWPRKKILSMLAYSDRLAAPPVGKKGLPPEPR